MHIHRMITVLVITPVVPYSFFSTICTRAASAETATAAVFQSNFFVNVSRVDGERNR